MHKEILPREKAMHELMEKMHAAYEAACSKLHTQLSSHVDQSREKSAQLNAQREQHVDPMKAMEEELSRIQQLLAHQVVQPDIVNWQPSTRSVGSPSFASRPAQSSTMQMPRTGSIGSPSFTSRPLQSSTYGSPSFASRPPQTSSMQSPLYSQSGLSQLTPKRGQMV